MMKGRVVNLRRIIVNKVDRKKGIEEVNLLRRY